VFIEKLKERPVIAAIRDLRDIPLALKKKIGVLFLLAGDIFDLIKAKEEVKSSDVLIFSHLDLMRGIARDKAGISFLKQKICIDGLLTTHTSLIQFAKKEGLITIQRLFILDSEALKTGVKMAQGCKPDAVEILPGIILPALKNDLENMTLPPIIAGGLIRTEGEIRRILESGALAVSTSKKELWGVERFC